MPKTKVLLITGLLRGFESCLDYLDRNEAYEKYEVILSTWEHEVSENSASITRFMSRGGNLVTTPPIHLGRFTSVVSQHLSLARGLEAVREDDRIVIKTRTDWMVQHDILNLFDESLLRHAPSKILVVGFNPSSPYFLPDGHFITTAMKMRGISNLDLTDLLRLGYLHPEQNFFLPNYGMRSVYLDAWLTMDLGTQYDVETTQDWINVRLESGLYYFVIGEYLRWVKLNIVPMRIEKKTTNLKLFKEFLFGPLVEMKSSNTGLIIHKCEFDEKDYSKFDFLNPEAEKYFWRGYCGEKLEKPELDYLSEELQSLIDKSIRLVEVKKRNMTQGFRINIE